MEIQAELYQLGTVLLAAFFGGLIGIEREIAGKAAGLRTHVFVSAGSALLVVLSDSIVSDHLIAGALVDDEHLRADPIRIVQAIVVAISFLGAGTIVHERGKPTEGLTTAGSIYLTAGVGIAVAVNQLVLASGTVILAVIILWCVGRVERHMASRQSHVKPSDIPPKAVDTLQNLPKVS